MPNRLQRAVAYGAVGVTLIAFGVACSGTPRQPTSEEKWRRAQLVARMLGNESRFADWKVSDFDQWYCWLETDWHAQLPVYAGSGPWDVMAHAVIACPTRSLEKLPGALKELFPKVDPEQIDTAVADAIAATRTIGP